jgi:hypothetical protein
MDTLATQTPSDGAAAAAAGGAGVASAAADSTQPQGEKAAGSRRPSLAALQVGSPLQQQDGGGATSSSYDGPRIDEVEHSGTTPQIHPQSSPDSQDSQQQQPQPQQNSKGRPSPLPIPLSPPVTANNASPEQNSAVPAATNGELLLSPEQEASAEKQQLQLQLSVSPSSMSALAPVPPETDRGTVVGAGETFSPSISAALAASPVQQQQAAAEGAAGADAAPSPPRPMDLARARAVLMTGARFERFVSVDAVSVPVFVYAAPRLLVDTDASSSSSTPRESSPSSDQQLVLWVISPAEADESPRPRHVEDSLPLFAIRDVYKGALSEPLAAAVAASDAADAAPPNVLQSRVFCRDEECMVLKSARAALSLQAVSRAVRDEWVAAVCCVLENAMGKQKRVQPKDEKTLVPAVLPPAASDAVDSNSEPWVITGRPARGRSVAGVVLTEAAQVVAAKESAAAAAGGSGSADGTAPGASVVPDEETLTAMAASKALLVHDIQLTLLSMTTAAAELLAKDKDLRGRDGKLLPNPARKEFDLELKKNSNKLDLPVSGGPGQPRVNPDDVFEAKAYAPTVFARLRSLWGIDDATFLSSVAGAKGYADLIVNSKSGAFFFYSADQQYLLKSCTVEENRLLIRHMLPSYWAHVSANPNSLLTKFAGAFRLIVRAPRVARTTVHFIVMRNVFATGPGRRIDVRFDLKGSTYGRAAKPAEKAQRVPVLKDVDFFEGTTLADGRQLPPTYLELGSKRKAFLHQLTVDAEYLRSQGIMDYSLLVGIHYAHVGAERSKSPAVSDEQQQLHALSPSPSPSMEMDGAAGSGASVPVAAAETDRRPAPLSVDGSTPAHRNTLQVPNGNGVAPKDSASSSSAAAAVPKRGSNAKQTNYGLKPQKEVLIPRQVLRRASLMLSAASALSSAPAEHKKTASSDRAAQEEAAVAGEKQGASSTAAVADSNGAPAPDVAAAASSPAASLPLTPAAVLPSAALVEAAASRARSRTGASLTGGGGVGGPPSLFEREGIILSEVELPDGSVEVGAESYYLGVIDILQQYTNAKRVEHTLKALVLSADAISCTDPYAYERRFLAKIASHLRGDDTPDALSFDDADDEQAALQQQQQRAQQRDAQRRASRAQELSPR